MLNVIRTCPNRIKYCGKTVDNLIASNEGAAHRIIVVSSNKTPNENGLDALRAGIEASGGHPFCFLEDDLAFIRGFNQAASDFTQDCDGTRSLIIPLCAAYKEAQACRGVAWQYPIRNYFGSQAFVIRPDDAKLFLEWAKKPDFLPSCFDLMLKQWAQQCHKTHFLAPTRSFVQHIGVESSLHNGRFHHYSSWPGPDWRYQSTVFPLSQQKNRPCDHALAGAIAKLFGKKLHAYDFGCSTGNYVADLRKEGLAAKGFDATPGIASDIVDEVDLSRPQKFHETPGNVMCLEVGEHIHQENEQHLITNIETLCTGRLVLSWARPGQGGNRHVNEKHGHDVVKLMEAAGFRYDHASSKALRAVAQIPWFHENLYTFTR